MATFSLNIAGHDAQHRCADVVIVEAAFNYATEHQGYARCYRIGQTEAVDITRLFVEDTYQEVQEFHMTQKAKTLFAAFMEINEEIREEAKRAGTLRTSDEVVRDAFGQFRRRVLDRKYANLAKEEAREANAVEGKREDDAADGDSDASSDGDNGVGVGGGNGVGVAGGNEA